MCVYTYQIMSQYSDRKYGHHLYRPFIQNLLSNQSRYNILLVSQELEMMYSYKRA